MDRRKTKMFDWLSELNADYSCSGHVAILFFQNVTNDAHYALKSE